jgi:hypothetical protein
VSLLDAKSKVRIARALLLGKPHASFANGIVLRFHTRRANLAQGPPRKPLVRVRSIVGEPEVIHVANYGNDSCSVSNAVQFADLEFQAEMCNECRRLFSTVDVQSPRKLRRKRVQRANGRDTFGNQTRETHSHAQRFSMGSDSFSQHLK